MNTPVLTKLQQKRSLSSKKKLKKVTIRNILTSPYVNYWPLLKPEDAVALNKILKQQLIRVKPFKVNVPWKELKTVPREQRKEFRAQYIKTDCELIDKAHRSDIVFGTNETTKLLESNNASSVLISEHVDPKFMIKHLLDMAVLNKVPILVVSNLNNILKEHTGIASMAIAFKNNSNMGSNYMIIDQKIKEIAAKYPPPTDHINFHRRESEHEDIVEKSPINISTDTHESDSEEDVKHSVDLYLYRNIKSERAFVPELSKQQESTSIIDKMEVDDSNGFLAFNKSEVNDSCVELREKSKSKTKISYKSLLIKRVTNNKDRDKNKIDMLKRKR